MSTPYMSLTLPTPGVTKGPDYAANINTAFTVVDSHNHSPGQGIPISNSGINLISDLEINGHSLLNTNALFLATQLIPLPSSNTGCVYQVNGNLYFNNGNGLALPITNSTGVVGKPGSITNLTAPAGANYVALNGTVVFQSNANTAASLDLASIFLRTPGVTNSNALLLQAPTLGTSPGGNTQITLTLPAVPVSNSYVTIDTSGVLSGSMPVATLQQTLAPAGVISAFAGSVIPAGWLLCDGSAQLRTAYPNLWTALGLTWQTTADATHFNIPNLLNRSMRGAAAATDGNGGDTVALGAYQGDEFSSHNHGGGDHAHSFSAMHAQRGGNGGDYFNIGTESGQNTSSSGAIISSNGGNENRVKAYGVNYIIKT